MAYSIEGTAVPNLSGGNTWSGTNAFNGTTGVTGLTATSASLDSEGYPIVTEVSYTAGSSAVTNNKVPYTSWTKRTAGPTVIVVSPMNAVNSNSDEGYPAGVGVVGQVVGDSVYNAIWNDMVDCITVPEDTILEPGYAYRFDGEKYTKTTGYLDQAFIGIHSDTYGFGTGCAEDNRKQLYTAIAGFVLAYVDKDYPPGTPLTCTENGWLTELKIEDMKRFPYLLVGTFWKPESEAIWGNPVRYALVNDRKWIRVR